MAFDVSTCDKVQRYADWARSARDSQVAGIGDEGQLASLSKLASPFARLFKLSFVDDMRQSAVNGFKAALKETVGATIADQAWKAIEGAVGKGKGLTAGMIRTALAETNKIMEMHKALIPLDEKIPEVKVDNKKIEGDEALAVHLISVSTNMTRGGVGNDINIPSVATLKFNYNATVAIEKADRLLGKTPASRLEAKNFEKDAEKVIQDLRFLKQGSAFGIQKGIVGRIEAKIKQLEDKIAEVKGSVEHFPSGEESLKGLADHWNASLLRACAKIIDGAAKKMDGGKFASGLENMQVGLSRLMQYYTEDGGAKMIGKIGREAKKLPDNLQKELTACVKSAFGGKIPSDLKKILKDVFKDSHLEVLNRNRGSWAPIKKAFTGFVGGKAITLESDITCGRHIDKSIADAYDSGDADRGVQSFSCHTKKTAHAVNLATTQLQIAGADGKKRTVFSGVRHGVHSADKVPGMKTAEANVKRAEQTVTAAFKIYLTMQSSMQEAFATMAKGKDGVIDFPMTSISLLTPTKLEEGLMLKAQTDAWKAVNGKTMTVTVDGKPYTVRPHIQTFNYGVNKGAVSLGPFSAVTGGWAFTALMNAKALNGILGQATEFEKTCPNPKTKKAVRTLVAQIKEIVVNHGEMQADGEAYKMPARLAVLTNLMGGVPVWNCKSGKDRTGMLDVEAKFLATLIDQGQDIPAPGAKLSSEQSALLRTIAMKSGNLEMQQYNTGIAGYKLSGVSSVYARMGAGHDEKTTLKGGSGYVGS